MAPLSTPSSTLMSGYVDVAGRFVIPPTLRSAEPFEGGVARAIPYGSRTFGFLGTDGRWIVPPHAAFFGDHDGAVRTFNVGGARDDRGDIVGGAWGWTTPDRSVVTPAFDDVGTPYNGFIPVARGGRWGLAALDGRVVVEPTFEHLGAVEAEGAAACLHEGKAGYLRPDGTWMLPPTWEAAFALSDGRGRVRIGSATHVIDLAGTVLSEGYDRIDAFLGGMARVYRGEQVGFVGLDGRFLGSRWFDESQPYAEGMAPVRAGSQWFLLLRDGRCLGPWATAMSPQSGLSRFVPEGGDVGFVRSDGAVIVAPRYATARGFQGGHAPVLRDGRWTFIDTLGRELYPPRWEAVGAFDDGVVPVRVDGRWGVADVAGQLVVPPTFDTLGNFADGRAPARAIAWPTQVPVPGPAWSMVPSEGLAHPGFADAGPDDEIRVAVCLSRTPDEALYLAMQQIVSNWIDVADAQAGRSALVGERWVADYAVALRFSGLRDPVRAAALLVGELAALGLPVHEVVFGRFRPDPDEAPALRLMYPMVPAVLHPRDGRGPTHFANFADFLAAAFDPAQVPPRSESAMHLLAGRWDGRAQTVRTDERTFSLWLPDVRICYGVWQPPASRPDVRADALANALTEVLAQRFDRSRIWVFPGARDVRAPVPLLRDGSPGVQAFDDFGRRGYEFGIEAVDLLQDIGPDCFRYREPELMEALAAVIRRFELAPVITWQRFGNALPGPSMVGAAHPMHPNMYVFNLWERGVGDRL